MHWFDDDEESIAEYMWILATVIMIFVLAGALTVFNIMVFELFTKPRTILILFYSILSIIISNVIHMTLKKMIIKSREIEE